MVMVICFGCNERINVWEAKVRGRRGWYNARFHARCQDSFNTGFKAGSDSERGKPKPERAAAVQTLRDIIGAYLTPATAAEQKALYALEELS